MTAPASEQTARNRRIAGRKAAQAKKAKRPWLEEAMAGARDTRGAAPVIDSIADILARARARAERP